MSAHTWVTIGCIAFVLVAYAVRLWIEAGERRRSRVTEEQLAGEPKRAIASIQPERLVVLCLASGTVFPWVHGRPPERAAWQGTAEDLRARLLAPDSMLRPDEKAEIPHALGIVQALRRGRFELTAAPSPIGVIRPIRVCDGRRLEIDSVILSAGRVVWRIKIDC